VLANLIFWKFTAPLHSSQSTLPTPPFSKHNINKESPTMKAPRTRIVLTLIVALLSGSCLAREEAKATVTPYGGLTEAASGVVEWIRKLACPPHQRTFLSRARLYLLYRQKKNRPASPPHCCDVTFSPDTVRSESLLRTHFFPSFANAHSILNGDRCRRATWRGRRM